MPGPWLRAPACPPNTFTYGGSIHSESSIFSRSSTHASRPSATSLVICVKAVVLLRLKAVPIDRADGGTPLFSLA